MNRCPDQSLLPFALWTREAVVDLIERETGRRVSVWTAGRCLKRWNMTPQKPARRACERDPAAVRDRLDGGREGPRKLELFFLPGYSPELNPDECLNPDTKQAMSKRRPRHQGELVNNVRSHLRRRQKQPEVVRRFFHEEHVRHAACTIEDVK